MIAKADSDRVSQNDCSPRYYGKYRGTVYNNVDPNGLGRVQVVVPQVSPLPLANWAMMCPPVGGLQHGMFSVPAPAAGVWVEFEQGDIDYPIWSGCIIGGSLDAPKQAPTANPLFQSITLQTPTQNCVIIDDTPVQGGVTIKTRTGATIAMTDIDTTITNGLGASIRMIGSAIMIEADVVSINGTNLMIYK